MGKLKEILQNRDAIEKLDKLRKYAYEEGLSSPEIVEGQAKLIEKIASFERHKTTVKATYIGAAVASAWLIWNIIYCFFIYPPKYTLDNNTTLYFAEWFGRRVAQTKKGNLQADINIYQGSVDFELHFILHNHNRGEGEVSKPILIITAENSKKEFPIEPYTQASKVRTIKVSSYGIVDDFFDYSIKDYDEAQKELLEFLKENRKKLKFKIKGNPYGEFKVELVENYRRRY